MKSIILQQTYERIKELIIFHTEIEKKKKKKKKT